MAGNLQFLRNTTANIAGYVGPIGELVLNTDDLKFRVQDGLTAGGWILTGHAVNAQTGTSYVVLVGDQGKLVTLNNGSAVAVTMLQAGMARNFPSGGEILFLNRGAGAVTITPTTSTVNGAPTLVLTQNQWAYFISDGTNYFALLGSVANTQPYDLGGYVGSAIIPTANQVILRYNATRPLAFPAAFGVTQGGTSEATAEVAATGSTVFSIDKAVAATPNTFSSIGTITFAAAAVRGTFTSAGGLAQSLAQGDVLRIIAPGTPDATLAGISVVLAGSR